MAKLNELSAKDWVKSTKSWFVLRGKARGKDLIKHPAKFPEELAEKFILFFTKSGETVLDPFMGVGSTGVAALQNNRRCFGIEINESFCAVSNDRLGGSNVVLGDSRDKKNYINNMPVDFILTSPPYWDILRKKRGNSDSQHTQRQNKNLDLYYSDNPNDLGNITDYVCFMNELKKVFKNCNRVLSDNKYMVVVVQNFRNADGHYMTFSWDLTKVIESCGFTFEGEQIWCQDDKQLGIWGYPSKFISNVHHHYCLVFKKNA